MLPKEIFKAYDIRGVVDKTLTREVVSQIGQALGSEALARKQSSIIVGRDGRLSGPMLVDSLAQGIMATGCDVVDIGQAPTPTIYFAGFHLDTPSVVAVTGSHNPPEYNGLKIVLDGETLSGGRIQAIRQKILDRDFLQGAGQRHQLEVIDAYIERIVKDIHLNRPL